MTKVKKELQSIIDNSSSELAVEEILHLFSVNKRYSLNYLDSMKIEQSVELWAKDEDDALNELKKIDASSTYIFISRL